MAFYSYTNVMFIFQVHDILHKRNSTSFPDYFHSSALFVQLTFNLFHHQYKLITTAILFLSIVLFVECNSVRHIKGPFGLIHSALLCVILLL